jgi:tetratricopeptide (TPR) repeat protein
MACTYAALALPVSPVSHTDRSLEWYFSLQIWPEPIKTPLKKALKARGQGDYDRADEFFREAVTAAQSVPPSALDPDPLRKLSGIYITWATMLEGNGQPVRAFVAYRDALGLFGPSPLAKDRAPANGWAEGHVLDDEDHLRAIGLAQKLGQIAVRMGSFPIPPPFPHAATDKLKSWDGAGEAYLSGALGAMLRLGLAGRAPPTPESGPVVIGRDVNLPEKEGDTEGRVNRRGLGMTMEALAEVYARQGQYALAGQLLIQAISTLVPPQDKNPSVADRCQAAMVSRRS